MEMQINDLVSAIRKEGVLVAEAEAEKIIAEAKKRRLISCRRQRQRQTQS